MSSMISNDELGLFVGKKTDYYLAKFTQIENGNAPAPINYAAAFLSAPWLLYRKMYLFGTLYFGVVLLLNIVSDIVFVDILGNKYSSNVFDGASKFMVFGICGALGTRWYFWHIKKKITEIKQEISNPDSQQDAIRQAGGVNLFAAIFGTTLLSLIMVVILVLIKMAREGKF